ncbi:hypothetical protein BHE74_00042264 [Ensete ventricosum]|nr:hypothetical protein BHE74_00042264 [Ensete ventricosum]
MGVTICLSIDQGELLGEHRGVEVSRRRGEEAMTSPEELNYPKAKHWLEWRARSVTMPQRRIYQLRSKGHRCEGTDSSVMAW